MAVSRIRSRLDDDVRCFVDGVSGRVDEVEQATASTRSIEESVSSSGHRGGPNRRCCGEREPSSANRGLWSFYSNAKGELAPKVFDNSEAVLPLPGEADGIL